MMMILNILLGMMLGLTAASDVSGKWYLVMAILFFIYIYNFDMEGYLGDED